MGNVRSVLSFGKGITNVPSDAICDDNALEECMGMVFMDGEHRVVQEPVEVLTGVQGTILYIHKIDGDEANDRYILRNGTKIVWRTKDGTSLTGGDDLLTEDNSLSVKQVTSIGKTLILSTNQGMRYFIRKADSYGALDDIPEPQVEFILTDYDENQGYDPGVALTQELGNIFDSEKFHTPYMSNQKAWNDFVIGQYSRNKNAAAKVCRFVNPFFVRVAVEMYDGTYTKISAPILMVPNIRWNSEMKFENSGDGESLIRTWSCNLRYKLKNSYENYSDLVNGVVVFVSKEVETQKTTDDIPALINFWAEHDGNRYGTMDGTLLTISWPTNDYVETAANVRVEAPMETYVESANYDGPNRIETEADRRICKYTKGYDYTYYPVPIPRDTSDIIKDIKEVSIFYKLAELGRLPNSAWDNIRDVAESGALENLTSQTALTADNSSDYFDHTKLAGEYAYVYNSRLNLADVKRSFFEGYDRFMLYDNSLPGGNAVESDYRAYVTIRTDSNDSVVIKKEYTTSQKQGLWFYYPDPRATHVQIFKVVYSGQQVDPTDCILDVDLTEHKGLNGAYYFGDLPFDSDHTDTVVPGITEPAETNNGDFEELTNYIIASEFRNPFVFKAEGYVQVGVGKVKAVSTVTQALSQGQFGSYPLVAFTDNGIWALGINKDGIIIDTKPKEREVITGVQSITQTDGAVFFASAKGLMAVVGNQNGVEVRHVSEQLSGRIAAGGASGTVAFAELVKGAIIAYDYRDSLLWIFDGRGNGSRYCWIYSIKSGTFSRYDFGEGNIVTNVVNSYPDYLLQIGGKVYSLLERPDINVDGETVGNVFTANTYTARMVTRALKFEDATGLKSIRQIRNVHDMQGQVRYRLFASNDLKSWRELKSLRGMPWKYYKMQFDFTGLRATDRFAGTVVVTQERRTNKLR